jgi:curved DNA-binding protein CbpA
MADSTEPIPAEAYEIDLYAVLQITSEATAKDVRTAFRRLILKHHPDKVQPSERAGAHERSLAISLAYSVLYNADKRKMYDLVRYSLKVNQRSGKAERPPTPRPQDGSPSRPRYEERSGGRNSHTKTGKQGQQQEPDNGPFWRFGSEPRWNSTGDQPADKSNNFNKQDDMNFRRWAAAQPGSEYNDFKSSNEAAGSGHSKMKGHHSKAREDGYRTGSEYDPPIFDYQRTSESGFSDPPDFEQPGFAKDETSTEKNRDHEQWGRYFGYQYARSAEDGAAEPNHKHNGGGTDPTQAYENEPFANKNNEGKFNATSGLRRHFGGGSGRNGELRGYIHVRWEPTLPR